MDVFFISDANILVSLRLRGINELCEQQKREQETAYGCSTHTRNYTLGLCLSNLLYEVVKIGRVGNSLGERGRIRTCDPCLKRALLYHLSYAPAFAVKHFRSSAGRLRLHTLGIDAITSQCACLFDCKVILGNPSSNPA